MSDRRVRFGDLGSGLKGVKISKPGYDALTAAPQNLLLNASEKYSNLLKLGVVYGSASVAMGFGARPFVTITAIGDLTSVPDVAWPSNMIGPVRPSPVWLISHVGDQTAYATVAGDGSSLTIASPVTVWYSIYSGVNSI
jgi:hypothetical protein